MALRRYLSLFVSLVVLALVVAACGGGDEATPASPPAPTRAVQPTPTAAPTAVPATPTPAGPVPKTGGILKAREIGLSFRSWDTYGAGSFTTLYNQDMLSNLIVSDRVNKHLLLPDTAARWTVSNDGKAHTFFLRQGITWHDGKPFTPADVVYNLNRAWKPADPATAFNKSKMRFVENVEAVDPFTVRVTLTQPSASFLTGLATPFMLMYPTHVPDLQQWQANPIGTGPFKFKEFKSGSNLDLVKNETYYKKDDAGRQLPYLDGVTFFVIADPTLALSSFRTHRIDCGCGFDNDFLTNAKETLEKEIPGLKLLIANGDSFDFFFRNKPPFDNILIRKAIATALDYKELRSLYRRGLGHYPPTLFLSQDLGGAWSLPSSEMLKVPGFREPKSVDLEEASRLFAQAGVKPADVKVDIVMATFFRDFGEALQAVMAKTGVAASIQIFAAAQQTTALTTGNFSIGLKQGGHSWDDPVDLYVDNFTSKSVRNYGGWSDAEVDRLANEQDRELDPAKRRALMGQLSRRLLDQAFYLPLASSPNASGAHPNVSGFVIGPYTVGSHLRHELLWFNS